MPKIKILKRKLRTAHRLAKKNMGTLYTKFSNQLLYGVTVIVPFYNAGQTLNDTCESLLNQKGIDELTLEVLLIDNNSTDESTKIAKKYAKDYPNIFRYLLCKTQGVSNARNFGLEKARAKFITFLDADDTFSETAIKDAFSFFVTHDDEVEIVFLPRYFMTVDENGHKTYKPHHRNKLFKNTSVYDETENNYSLYFTSPNVMIKNNQPYRFEPDVPYGEDMLFISKFLALNNKIGFVKSAHYNYRFSEFSTVDKYTSPTMSAELILDNMSRQFKSFLENSIPIPRVVQSMAFNEVAWRYSSLVNKFFPYHLNEVDYRSWEIKLRDLLRLIEDDVILSYPNLDGFHKYSILLLKEEPIKLAIFDSLDFRKNGLQIHEEKEFETVITDLKVSDHKFYLSGFLKVKLGEIYHVQAFVAINGVEKELETWQSVSSRYRKRDESNDFTAFKFEYDLNAVQDSEAVEIYIYYKVDDKIFEPKRYWHTKNRILDINNRSLQSNDAMEVLATNTIAGVRIELLDNFHYWLTSVDKEIQKNDFEERTYKTSFALRELREQFKLLPKTINKVWLYIDNYNVIDNAFYQYLNDFNKEDGIKRYYIYKSDFRYVHDYLYKEKIDFRKMKFIKYGSGEHKKLMIQTEYVLGSFNEYYDVIVPFTFNEMIALSDILTFKYIYLQHGVLHSKQPQTYDVEKTLIDKIVISSDYEREVFTRELHYDNESLLQVGMSRFDTIKKDTEKQARILFAPSFRHGFVGDLNQFDINGNRQIDKDMVFHSKYYKSLLEIAESKYLNQYLKEHNLDLDIKLHPIFSGMSEILCPIFEDNDRINLIDYQVESSQYLIFVTDFSSFVFDAVNICQPIIYFELDKDEFASGNHHYRELYLDFEFGDVVDNVNDFISAINKIVLNDYQVSPQYLEKMTSFYNYPDNSRESLYQVLYETNYKESQV